MKNAVLFSLLLLGQASSFAGSVEGPYVIWINLSQNPEPANLTLSKYLNGPNPACWDRTALLFMRDKPKAITKDLARRALVKRERKAIDQLNSVLKKPHGKEVTESFDGIVVYTDTPAPHMYSLATGARRVDSMKVDLSKAADGIEATFCELLPPIQRLP